MAREDNHIFDTCCIFGLLIILLSLFGMALIVEHFVTIRKSRLLPDDVLDDLEQMIAIVRSRA